MYEPRTNAEIMRDLLDALREREWIEERVYCGRGCNCYEGTRQTCSGCSGDGAHAEGCKIAALIAETEAFLRVEDALEEERAKAEPTR